MKIITNNKPRQMVYGYELPDSAKSDFDYLDPSEFEMHDFAKYKGNYYDVSEFMRVPDASAFAGWDGYSNDSYFSGVLIKMVDSETVILGRYFA